MADLEERDAIVADAIEAEFRYRKRAGLLGNLMSFEFDPEALREAAESAALRARRDAEEIEASVREVREAADA